MKLMRAEQIDPSDRAAWLEWRRRGIGASDMPAVVGVSPHRTALHVYLAKIGRGRDSEPTQQQRIGHACEAAIADLYEQETGRQVLHQQVPAYRPETPYLLATLDGVTADGRIVEFKTCGSLRGQELGEVGTDDLPREWLVQAHHQMLVADAPRCDFAVLCGGYALEFKTFTVERSAEWDSLLLEEGGQFWDRVLMRDPPPPTFPGDADSLRHLFAPDGSRIEADEALTQTAGRLQEAKGAIKSLQSECVRLECEIRQAMGGAILASLPDGRAVKRIISRVDIPAKTTCARSYTNDYIRIVKGAKAS